MSTPDPDKTVRMDSSAQRHREDAQFAPGTMVAGRYRISSLLGAGGMGEVYRADDIKLGQAVALKFLPARLARDPILLGRLHDEVRHGRQITHPNVCRIYDIVESDGAQFVAMEYVDGEDLSRLLRRIGRLAHDKAVDIARGITSGLMAAHAKGILHRDLKPANVMIDSRGDARVMDFGLALVAGEDDGTISGTPAYMAPEQLAGGAATVQSDLYSLGLVMYELFTGKRAHSARTMNERTRDITTEITTPSSVIPDIHPAVERIILRCLSNDPAQRPRSAREVIELLPGGDPLAAALLAGETPSPRVVAAAGTEGSLSPRVAWTLLLGILVLVASMFVRMAQQRYLDLIGLTTSPVVLEERAAETLRRFGIPEQRFRSYGFEQKERQLAWIYVDKSSPAPWERLRRGLPVATFWMRMEAGPLLDSGPLSTPQPARLRPPQESPGSAAIELNPRGGLFSLRVVPEGTWKPRPLPWDELLAAAGLSQQLLKSEAATFTAPVFADARAAWSGTHPQDGTPVRVEAAAFRGTPVFFRIVAPWDEKDVRGEMPFAGTGFAYAMGTLLLAIVLAGAFLALRNLRLRRGDRSGALRLGLAFFVVLTADHVITARHAPDVVHEVAIVFGSLQSALLDGVLFALLYIAVEPFIRRRWPDRLIAWARLLSGNWRDPMVGRDVLIGLLGGAAFTAISMWGGLLRRWIAGQPAALHDVPLFVLETSAAPFAHLLRGPVQGMTQGLALMGLLVLLTMFLRRRALAVAAFYAIVLGVFLVASTETYAVPVFAAGMALVTYILARHGLLAAATMWMTFSSLFFVPFPEGIPWATSRTFVIPAAFVLAAIWAFRVSLGGQPAFARMLDE